MRYLPPATAIAGEGRYPGEPGAEEGTAAALNMEDILYVLRKRRNDAVHAGLDSRHNSIAVPGTNVVPSAVRRRANWEKADAVHGISIQ